MKKFKNSRLSTDSRKLQTLALKYWKRLFLHVLNIFTFLGLLLFAGQGDCELLLKKPYTTGESCGQC